MKGSTIKRCGCTTEYDSKGRRKACNKRHGSWSYIIDVGKDPATGKRRQLRKSGFATQAEAATAMAEVIGEVDQGRYRHDAGQTVGGYLDVWLQNKATEYRPTTLSNARRWLAATKPHIGHLRLRDLQAGHLSKMYRDITADNATRGVGTTTTRRIHGMLSSALSDARREGLIRHNPAGDATVPKEHRPKVNPWNGTELGAFLDHAVAHPMGSIYELMAMAGMRRGEAMGQRWQDVDLDNGFLVVRQQLLTYQPTPERPDEPCPYCGAIHRGLLFGPPKTSNGEDRRIDLGQTAVGMLLGKRLEQEAERAEWGDAYVEHDLVFAHADGNPINPNYVTKTFTTLASEAGLRRIRLHDLRHGRASLMLAAGIDIAVVSKILGHASIRTTADTYSHLLEGVGKAAAEAADSLIVRQMRDQSVTSPARDAVEAPSS